MKKLFVSVLTSVLALSLVACSNGSSNTEQTETGVKDGEYTASAEGFGNGEVKVTKLTSEILTNLINSGTFVLAKRGTAGDVSPASADYVDFTNEQLTSVATNTGLREVSDETNLKKAEAKYEADMKKIDNKDKKYDTDLAALETERNAVKEEMETLKTVAKENVERTFKLFS